MKFIDEYRNPEALKKYLQLIDNVTTRPWTIMELCGGQTHSIVKYRIQELIPPSIRLVHGPGCPVCVTSLELIDKAIEIALQSNVIFCSFGDMLRVPGSMKNLLMAKAEGADIRVVYSPLDALKIARDSRNSQVVFFGVGFETTAPAIAMSIHQAKEQKLKNYSVLCSHFLVPPAMEAILDSPKNLVQGFLAAGHVCTIMGYDEYFPISEKYRVPIVVTGFEPLDIVTGLYECVKQLEEGKHEVVNQYARSVRKQGNAAAQKMMKQVFDVIPRKWRGIGSINHSGLGIRKDYAAFDAEKRFSLQCISCDENPSCISAEILQGFKKPHDCPSFGKQCTPENPLGAPMVSSEGACAAYYRYQGVLDESVC